MVLTKKQLDNYRTPDVTIGEHDRINFLETIDALFDENDRLRELVDDERRATRALQDRISRLEVTTEN